MPFSAVDGKGNCAYFFKKASILRKVFISLLANCQLVGLLHSKHSSIDLTG